MKFKSRLRPIAFLAILVGLSACGHGLKVQEFPDTASPRAEIDKLSDEMDEARENQVDVLSPENFENAEDSLGKAKERLDRQKSAQSTLREVAKGKAYLLQANEFADLSLSNLQGVVSARAQALEARAPEFLPEEFEDADEDLKRVTSRIEKNDLDDAMEKRSELQLTYMDLELQAIKQAYLNGPRDTIEKAIGEGAKEFAPRSLAIAEKSVVDTEAYITANRHNESEINEFAKATAENANHLLKITRDAKAQGKMSPEDSALRLEEARDTVSEKQSMLEAQRSEIEAQEGQIAEVKDASQSLRDEREFEKRFNEAQAQFSEDEAVVYKQGDNLVIRLKSLDFPVAKADLRGGNFALLAKVQKVIEEFGASNITVEGHTDSTGSEALNEKLSLERADAVRAYFEANSPGRSLDIKSVGYGYKKPLATNKTPAGRAQNRRVDIVIETTSPETL